MTTGTGPGRKQSLLGSAAEPIRRLLVKPSVRSSRPFRAARELLTDLPQEEVLHKAMAFTASCQLQGDYLEFGVYTGRAFIAAYDAAAANELTAMRFYAFDSFAGMPAPSAPEPGGSPSHEPGEFCTDRATFQRNIDGHGLDRSRVDIVAGWFDVVLTRELNAALGVRRAAIIYADCVLYSSTLCVLKFATDYVQDGTVVIFGDWFSYRGSPAHGQRRAFSEWLGHHPELGATEFHKFGWHGNSFILHKP